MAEKIEWHGIIPAGKVKWLTFAKQSGYTYNNDYTEITAFTDDNRFPDKIKFVVDYNSSADTRTCAVKFTQKGGKTITCHISQDGTTTFENFWKHAPKIKTPNKIPTDAVIAQSNNETMNPCEVAVGDYNRTRRNLLFSVGSGDENNRKNSFEVDDEKISADTAYISDLTAYTFSANTLNAAKIVNGSGADFVSYSSATKNTDTGLYPIGILKINAKKNVIYGKNRDKEIEDEVRNLSANTVTKTEFQHYYNSCATGLTDEFSAFTKKFDSYSGTVKEEIKNINLLARTATSNTLSLSGTVTDYYNDLKGKVSDVSNSYNELSQTLTGLTDRIGHVETEYEGVSGQIQSVSSTTDEFKVSLNGLSNKVETIKTDYSTLNGQVTSNTQDIGTLRATSDTFLSKLDSISVGGVNLLYDTNFDTFNKPDSKWSTWGSPSTLTMAKESDGWNWISIKSTDKFQGINQNQNSRRGAGYKEFKPNTYYTFSVYAYGNSTHMDLGVHFVNKTGTDTVGQVWCSNDNNYSKSWGKGVIPLTSTKTRYWFTFKTPDDSTINYFNAMLGFGSLSTNPSSDEVINIAKPQLEEGTIPTDWKENGDYYDKRMSSKIEQTATSITLSVQENVENKLLETGIDIENGKITLNADNTTVKGDLNLNGTFTAGSTEYNCSLKTIEEPTVNDQGQQVAKGTSGLYSYNKEGGYLEYVQDANGMSYGLMEIKQTAGEGTVMGTTKIDYFDIGIGLGSDTISYGRLKVSEIFNGEGDMPSNLKPIDISYAKVTPSYQKFTKPGTISASTQNVICKNTTDIALMLPSSSRSGTEIRIWKFGSNVTLYTTDDHNIRYNTTNDSGKSVVLNKTYALYLILFDGEDWLLTS